MSPFLSEGRSEQVITMGTGTLNVHIITHSTMAGRLSEHVAGAVVDTCIYIKVGEIMKLNRTH